MKLCGIGATYVGYGAAGVAWYGMGIPWIWLGYGTEPPANGACGVGCGGADDPPLKKIHEHIIEHFHPIKLTRAVYISCVHNFFSEVSHLTEVFFFSL